MDPSSLYSLGSSYYPPIKPKIDNSDRDFKKAKKLPIPPGLRERLPFPETPWKINTNLFKRLQFPPSLKMEKYHKLELTSSDPESGFVHLLFNHDRPTNRSIRKIQCMHNPNLTKAFESELALLEDRAKNPFFAPNIEEETDVSLRKRTLQRWQGAADLFSPIYLDTNPRNPQTLTKTYVLPLWHGTAEKICESIASDGFAISGSHAFKQGQTGDGIKTDVGFFGSGIYFTNSARYCSKAYAQGHMILAWVSMRQPFPVVADHPPKSFEDEPKDKVLLKGDHAYKRYTAHYIPVRRVPSSGKLVYYPCAEGQEPRWDEVVVFNHIHTLPRFWVELAVDLPRSLSSFPSSSSSSSFSSSSSTSSLSSHSSSLSISLSSISSQTLGSLLDKLYELLESPAVQQEVELPVFLESYIQALLSEDLNAPLSSQYLALANSISRLLDQTGKVRRIVAQSLLAKENKEKERKKISVDPSSGSQPLISGAVRLLEPEKGIRFLLSIPSSVSSTHVQREQPVLTGNVVTYLDGRSAMRLLTSCRSLKEFFLTQGLYAALLRRDFPALYQPLASKVSKQPQAQQGLLWQCLYAMSHEPDPQPQVLRGHTGYVTCLKQLADGRIASGAYDHTVRIWPLDGSPPTILKGHTGSVFCLKQLADGRIASGATDNTLRIWPLNRSSPTVLKGHTGSVFCLTQLADGRIASGATDNTVRIWALNGSPPTVLTGHTGRVYCLTQLADGRIVSGAGDHTVRIWPLNRSSPTVLTGHTAEVRCLMQLADGRIVSGAGDHTVRIWPLDGSPPTVLTGHTGWVHGLTQLADGRIASGSEDRTVRIWPLDGSAPTVLIGHTRSLDCLTQLVDGRIASWAEDNTVRIWPLNGSPPTVLTGHTGPVACLVQLVDGRIASGSDDSTVRIWGKDTASLFQRALPSKILEGLKTLGEAINKFYSFPIQRRMKKLLS